MYLPSRFSYSIDAKAALCFWLWKLAMLYKRPRQYSFSDFMCKTNIPAHSFFIQQVYILFKKENKNFNNVKDLMKNAVFRIPLRKKKKERNRFRMSVCP